MRDDDRKIDALAIGVLLLISACAFIRLLALPAFEDEGTELRWIWRVIEAREWLQPLNDGKPLQVWLMVPWIAAGFHPLTVIRTLNVLGGMLGAVLLYRFALEFTNHRLTAFICGTLLAICPFAVYLQRLALSETFLSTAGIWALLRVLRFVKSPDRSNALWLAASLVLAAFCKFPIGFLFALSVPLAVALMPANDRRRLLDSFKYSVVALAPVTILAVAVVIIGFIQVRRGSLPGFGLELVVGIGGGNYQDVTEMLGIPHIGVVSELTAQLSLPVVILGSIGSAASVLRGDWRARWLIAVAAIPLLALAWLAQSWYPRYLLFTLPPLIVASVLGWRSIAAVVAPFGKTVELAALIVCVILMGRQSAELILDPPSARWSELDRIQYFEGWGSGYGYPEAASYLSRAGNAPRQIFSLDAHSAYQLLAYLPSEWSKRVRPIVYAKDEAVLRTQAARLGNLIAEAPVWIVIAKELLPRYLETSFGGAANELDVREIAEFEKPGARSQLAFYEVRPRPRQPD